MFSTTRVATNIVFVSYIFAMLVFLMLRVEKIVESLSRFYPTFHTTSSPFPSSQKLYFFHNLSLSSLATTSFHNTSINFSNTLPLFSLSPSYVYVSLSFKLKPFHSSFTTPDNHIFHSSLNNIIPSSPPFSFPKYFSQTLSTILSTPH